MTVVYGDVSTYGSGAISTRPKLTVTYTEAPASVTFTVTIALEVKVTASTSFTGLNYALIYEDGSTVYEQIRPAAQSQTVSTLNQWVELTSYTRSVTRTVAKVHAGSSIDYYGEITVICSNSSIGNIPAEQGSGAGSIKPIIPAKTSYGVNYIFNGGIDGPFGQTKWHDEPLTLSTAQPTRDGYVFSHWNTNASNTGTSYDPGDTYTANADVFLTAIWNPVVSYDANGGAGAPASQTKTYGEDLTLSTTVPTRNGYSFVHWNTSSAGTGSSYASGATYSANVAATLYAIWTPIVSYDANGGSGAPASQTKPLSEPLTLSATTPTKAGYKFASWNTASDGSGTTYYPNGSYSSTETATLYAIWDFALTIGTMTVERADQGGAADVMGRYLKCSIPWSTDSAENGTKAAFTSGIASQTVTLTGTEGTATALLDVGALPTSDYTASVTVSDTVGASKSASATTTAASTGYTQPAILNMSVTRTDSTGEPEDGGEYVLVEFGWSVASVGSQTAPQSITVTAYDGSAAVDSDTVTAFSAATGSYSHVFGYGSTFKAEKTYLFTAVLTDLASSATKSEVLSIAYFTFDVLAGGHGVAFGKPSTTAELMDVGYEIHSDVEVSAIDANDVTHNLTEKADAINATQSADGLMSASDKAKLDGIETGAQVNTITGVKGDAESAYRTGDVNLTPANIGAVNKAGDIMTGVLKRTISAGVSYIAGNQGNAALYLSKPTGSVWYPAVTLDTYSGGSWSMGNYNTETLNFSWASKANRDSSTNSTTIVNLRNTAGTIALVPVQLYNNTTGTSGTVTLSQSAANFNHMRIYYRAVVGSFVGYGATDVFSPNGKQVDITVSEVTSSSGSGTVSQFFKSVYVSGTSMTRSFEKHYSLTFGTNSWAYSSNSNYVYVVRVEAWNE